MRLKAVMRMKDLLVKMWCVVIKGNMAEGYSSVVMIYGTNAPPGGHSALLPAKKKLLLVAFFNLNRDGVPAKLPCRGTLHPWKHCR